MILFVETLVDSSVVIYRVEELSIVSTSPFIFSYASSNNLPDNTVAN